VDDVGVDPSTPEALQRPERPTPQITTISTQKKGKFMIVGDSVLQGTECPVCQADPPHRELCCLPGARVRDITRKLPRLVQPSDYYPLLLFHVGGDEVAVRSPGVIKRDFRALGQLVRESGAPVIFSSLLPVVDSDNGRNRQTQFINTWLRSWCHHHSFGFFNNRMSYMAPGLLASGRIHLFQRRKRAVAQELVGLIDKALN